MIKTACAYVRVSTDKQEELSPDSQIREIKEYAARNNMLISKIYVEEHGISGKNASKRPAFQEMIATCKEKSHPYDVVLVWKFSRFARNIDESTYYKSILRKKCNVDVQSVSEPIIEGMYGRLIEMVIEWSDEFYLYNPFPTSTKHWEQTRVGTSIIPQSSSNIRFMLIFFFICQRWKESIFHARELLSSRLLQVQAAIHSGSLPSLSFSSGRT